MSSRSVLCPTCRKGILAESRPGQTNPIIRAVESVWMCLDKPTVVLLRCPVCGGAVEWKGKRLLIVDA